MYMHASTRLVGPILYQLLSWLFLRTSHLLRPPTSTSAGGAKVIDLGFDIAVVLCGVNDGKKFWQGAAGSARWRRGVPRPSRHGRCGASLLRGEELLSS